MKALQVYPIEVQAATGTVNLPYSSGISLIKISTAAPVTLTASFSLNLSAFEIGNDLYVPIYFEGDVTLDTFDFLVAGIAIKQSKLKGKAMFMLFYDATTTSWSIIVESDDNQLPDVIGGENSITAPTSGTVTLVPGVDKNFQRLTGTQTLVGNYTIAFGSGQENDWFYVYVTANITLSGNTLNIGGAVIDAATSLAGGYAVYGYCAGTTNWRTIVIAGNLDVAKIAAGSLSLNKIEGITAYSVLANTTAGVASPTAIPLAVNQVLSQSGATVITPTMLAAGGNVANVPRVVNIASASVLTGFASPITIETAQGAGTLVSIKNITVLINFNSAAYTGNTDLAIRYTGATTPIAVATGALLASAIRMYSFEMQGGEPILNAGLQLYVPTGNPSAGDSSITLSYELDVKPIAVP